MGRFFKTLLLFVLYNRHGVTVLKWLVT
jgi:hypothetical protein